MGEGQGLGGKECGKTLNLFDLWVQNPPRLARSGLPHLWRLPRALEWEEGPRAGAERRP